jgi:hypothetical protein
MRGGALLSATSDQPVGFDMCRKGWYELETGGFACATTDVTAFSGERLPGHRPLQADLGSPLPYPYGYSRIPETPVYRRLPSEAEARLYETPRPAAEIPLQLAPAALEAAARAEAAGLSVPAARTLPASAPEPEPAAPPTLASLQGQPRGVLLRRMERGFYVSLDREIERGERTYWQTQAAGYIPKQHLVLVAGSAFHGSSLEASGVSLPLAFVISRRARVYSVDSHGRLRAPIEPEYHHAFSVTAQVELGGKAYLVAPDGGHYLTRGVTVAALRDKPREVADSEKWLDVDLSSQTLVAYVGATPVYATAVSTGRIKDELDPLRNFQTPTGVFRITSKHLTATMDGDHALDGPYSIEDVPYVMYFSLAYALHSAFWHDSFGRPHSHGCVNLAPLDAKWLFFWTEPSLPPGWHGVYPEQQAGTRVYIRGETPKG